MVVAMEIERASAKIRAKGVVDDDVDFELPNYAERFPMRMAIGPPEPCPRLHPGVELPAAVYLEDLYVDPRTRGTGCGRLLIAKVGEAAEVAGASQPYWLTHETNMPAPL